MSDPFVYSSKHWFGKASAGVILGLTIALTISGIYAWLGPGGLMQGGGKTQFNMWIVPPIWAGIASFCFFFRNGLRAWLWLGAVNMVLIGILFAGKATIG